MRALNGTDSFRFMSQAWLQSFFFECPCADTNTTDCPALSLLNPRAPPLQCPTQEAQDDYAAAVKRGDIYYHGMPFNFEIENMSPQLLEASLRLVREFDRKFDQANTTTASIRDVIYVTRASIPILNAYGVNAITIGSNGANNPPQVPKLHLWRDEATGGELIVIYHPYGYGGYSKSTCAGPGRCGDCAVAPNGVACCTSFRTDNTGPPGSPEEGKRGCGREGCSALTLCFPFRTFVLSSSCFLFLSCLSIHPPPSSFYSNPQSFRPWMPFVPSIQRLPSSHRRLTSLWPTFRTSRTSCRLSRKRWATRGSTACRLTLLRWPKTARFSGSGLHASSRVTRSATTRTPPSGT